MKLKPCPFCGKEVKIQGGPEDWKPSLVDPDSGGDPYQITCECGCCFGLFNYDAEELANAWNKRIIQGCTREKLIKLKRSFVENFFCGDCQPENDKCRKCLVEKETDYLIENGVFTLPFNVGDKAYSVECRVDMPMEIEEIHILKDDVIFEWAQYDRGYECTETWDEGDFSIDEVGKTIYSSIEELPTPSIESEGIDNA